MNRIIDSARFVVEQSLQVKIDTKKIEAFCENYKPQNVNYWLNDAPFNIQTLTIKDRFHFLFLLDSLNFSYWGDPKWKIQYAGNELDGAYGMIGAIGRAIEKGIPVLNAKYLSNISESDFSNILAGNVRIPLFSERLQIGREVGTILLNEFEGDFTNIIIASNHDAEILLDLIIETFPSFRDESEYRGNLIYFYKRAQLLVSDIFHAAAGQDDSIIKNIDVLTAPADYKLPFELRRLGILSYSDHLAGKIDNKIEIDHNSEEEIEIRANTIWAVELIKQKLKEKIAEADSIHINDHLWMLSQTKQPDDKPYHLTRTTAY